MSTKIKSCSPGTKCEPILNDQAILSFFRTNELEQFITDDDARSLNDIGAYIGYSTDLSTIPTSYAGESHTENSGGVYERIKSHSLGKRIDPDDDTSPALLTNYMVLMNATVDGHRKIDGNIVQYFEHIFNKTLQYANKSNVINIKRTDASVSHEVFQKVICPILVDIKYSAEGVLGDILTPDNDSPSAPTGAKRFVSSDSRNEVYLKDSVILKHSHFRFPYKKIRESNDCFTLLTCLINAGVCIPYVYNGEVVMKFIIDTNLNNPHVINKSQKKDFMINERVLVSLMGSNVDFKNSFK